MDRGGAMSESRPGYERRLLMLAFDHRSSFAREVIGGDAEDERSAAPVREAKRLVFDGLAAAAESGSVPGDEVGVLIDEQYGSALVPLARERGLAVAVAVERSGQDVFDFEYDDSFGEHIDALAPDLAKVLVRLNVDGDEEGNALQLERLRRLGDWLRGRHRFLFELLVPATSSQLEMVGGDRDRYERELRPELIVRGIRAVQAAGIAPDVWKLEGVDKPDQAEAIAAQARTRPEWANVICVVLGAGAEDERVEGWLRVAATTEGYEGFAIGRSIWRAPIVAYLAGGDGERVVATVRDRFLHFAGVYLRAS